jgi:hypothetical protein
VTYRSPRRGAVRLACVAVWVSGLVACGSGAAKPTPSAAAPTSTTATPSAPTSSPVAGTGGVTAAQNAARLAKLDGNRLAPSEYEAAIAALEPICELDATDVAGLADAGYRQLAQNGIAAGSRLAVLDALRKATVSSVGITNCDQILAAYLVEQETAGAPSATPSRAS